MKSSQRASTDSSTGPTPFGAPKFAFPAGSMCRVPYSALREHPDESVLFYAGAPDARIAPYGSEIVVAARRDGTYEVLTDWPTIERLPPMHRRSVNVHVLHCATRLERDLLFLAYAEPRLNDDFADSAFASRLTLCVYLQRYPLVRHPHERYQPNNGRRYLYTRSVRRFTVPRCAQTMRAVATYMKWTVEELELRLGYVRLAELDAERDGKPVSQSWVADMVGHILGAKESFEEFEDRLAYVEGIASRRSR